MNQNDNKPGKTGEFPNGKLNEHDEGAIKVAVGIKDGVVILDFGSPVVWLGLDKESAYAIGNALITNASRLPG